MIKVLLGGDFLTTVVKEVQTAEESIWVAMFEWSWYPGQRTGTCQDINRAICIRAKSGVDARVLMHNESMGRTLHKINRRTGGHFRQSGVQVRWGNTGRPLHAKVWVFDKRRMIIGSHNISVRSVRTNIECSVLTDYPDEVRRVVAWFEELWALGM